MRINYNISSIIARNALNNNDTRLSNSVQRLSSGYKINTASDDAAGLAISRKMNAQIKSMQRANRNANDGVSVVNTADGAMSEMHDILQRMNELAIQAANGTNADSDREQIQKEIDQLVKEIDRIADTTQFNAQNLLDGSFAYKGYTNTENVKVMSYGDGVTSGTYIISKLTYYHYDEKTTYVDESKDVKLNERYEVNSADDVESALVTTSSVSAYKAAGNNIDGLQGFPEGTKVTLDEENIIIKAENEFEVKLTLNNRQPITDIATSTISQYFTTKSYNKIIVESDDGTRYNLSNLSIKQETDAAGNAVGDAVLYTGSEEEKVNGLKDDHAELFKEKYIDYDVSVESASFDGNKAFTVDFNVTNKKTGVTTEETLTLKLAEETNDYGIVIEPVEIDDYLYSTTETIRTQYEVGAGTGIEGGIALNMTGMGPMVVQVGANEGQILEIEIPALNAVNLGVDGLDISTEDAATAAIDKVGNAINMLSGIRAKIGAYTNRLEHTIANLDTTEENMTAAYSRIMDVDMATEMTEYSTVQVLVQASTAMLSQANERPQQVLQLLQ